jgi:putative endonuclease
LDIHALDHPAHCRHFVLHLKQLFVSDAWVYMLRCRDGSLYTGWTSDLERRMARHQAGKASRYTASRLPVELAVALPMADRTAARREEARIKMLPRAEKLALITEVKLARPLEDRPFADLDVQERVALAVVGT